MVCEFTEVIEAFLLRIDPVVADGLGIVEVLFTGAVFGLRIFKKNILKDFFEIFHMIEKIFLDFFPLHNLTL